MWLWSGTPWTSVRLVIIPQAQGSSLHVRLEVGIYLGPSAPQQHRSHHGEDQLVLSCWICELLRGLGVGLRVPECVGLGGGLCSNRLCVDLLGEDPPVIGFPTGPVIRKLGPHLPWAALLLALVLTSRLGLLWLPPPPVCGPGLRQPLPAAQLGVRILTSESRVLMSLWDTLWPTSQRGGTSGASPQPPTGWALPSAPPRPPHSERLSRAAALENCPGDAAQRSPGAPPRCPLALYCAFPADFLRP